MEDLSGWTPRPRPERIVLEGRLCRLEPLTERHADELFAAQAGEDERHAFLPEHAPTDRAVFRDFVRDKAASEDPLWFAVIDRRSGRVEGRQTLMRIDEANGVVETGWIYWGPRIARPPVTTEAFFLFARYVFDDLGYRRFEWKCNDRNEPSKAAALRYGMTFEGVFRQAVVVKGRNRDTAWFSLLDKEWPAAKAAFEAWLSPENFDAEGRQRRRLKDIREDVSHAA